jgi:transglutaminase-like putative cysteine protease
MKERSLGVLMAVAFAAPIGRGVADEQRPAPPAVLTTQFTYKATVPTVPAGTREVKVWLPMPSNSDWQTVESLKVESAVPYSLTQEKKYGNRMVYLAVKKPQGPVAVTVQFTVQRKNLQVLGVPGDANTATHPALNPNWMRPMVGPDSKVPIGGRFGDIALQLTLGKNSTLDKTRAIFDHVVATMQYDYKKESPKLGEGDVAFVCDYKKGNCSDLHSYVISLARSLGIPAILEYGFPITGIPIADPIPQDGKITGYHCWTWFKDARLGWIPLDASDARRWLDSGKTDRRDYLFGNLLPERSAVAISRGRDIVLKPAQKSTPLNYFIYPYAEADGKPINAEWVLSYHLPGPTAVANRMQ